MFNLLEPYKKTPCWKFKVGPNNGLLSKLPALNINVPATVLFTASYSVISIWPSPNPFPVEKVVVPSAFLEHK